VHSPFRPRTSNDSRRHSSPASATRCDSVACERGFTLPEVLVTCLIIAVLAAIAVPSFLSQQGKALDAPAKVLAQTAQTTAESVAADHSGSYEDVSPDELSKYEPTIHVSHSTSNAYLSAATGTQSEYSVTAKATNGDEFEISRNSSGEVTHTCVSPVAKTGCAGHETGTW
jgi:prepilin-type N-terminal cleavage/methylation domain-containing protein